MPEIRASLADQKNLAIFEGLPHQSWERDLLKSELGSKETTKIHDFHFYSKRLKLSADDLESLVVAITDENGIVEWGGMKLCGGYHPDYAVQWNDSNGRMFEALICFGCHEIKLYGDDGVQLYADLTEEAFSALRVTLSPYGDQRPASSSKG